MGGRKTDRAAAHNCDLVGKFFAASARAGVNRVPGFGSMPLGEESFQGADRDRFVDFAASARGLTRMCADPSAMLASGFGSRATRYASSNRPSAISPT